MRFLKALWLTLFFFFSLVFFAQNKEALTQKLQLTFDFYYFDFVWTNTPVPVYFVVLMGFLFGSLVTLGYLLMDRIRLQRKAYGLRKEIKGRDKEIERQKREIEEVKEELARLRNIPLLEEGDPLCSPNLLADQTVVIQESTQAKVD